MLAAQDILIEQLERKIKFLERENFHLKKKVEEVEIERKHYSNVTIIKYCNHLWKKTFTDSESKSLRKLRIWFLHIVGLKYSTLNFNEYTDDLKLVVHGDYAAFGALDDYFCGGTYVSYDVLRYYSKTLPEICPDAINRKILEDLISYIRANCNLSLIKDKYFANPLTV